MTLADIDLGGLDRLAEFHNRSARTVRFNEQHPALFDPAACDLNLQTEAATVTEARKALVWLLREVAARVERTLETAVAS